MTLYVAICVYIHIHTILQYFLALWYMRSYIIHLVNSKSRSVRLFGPASGAFTNSDQVAPEHIPGAPSQ